MPCAEKNCKDYAIVDYNSLGCYVCEYHFDRINGIATAEEKERKLGNLQGHGQIKLCTQLFPWPNSNDSDFHNKVCDMIENRKKFMSMTQEQFHDGVQVSCAEKNCKHYAVRDYNGCGHWVCEYHFNKLSDEFDDDYR